MKGLIAGLVALLAIGVLFFFLYAFPATPPPEMTDAEIAQIEAAVRQEVEARMAAFDQAVLAGDAEAAASFWTSDALLLEPGTRVAGGDFLSFVSEFFAVGGVTATDHNVLDFFVHGDVAYWIMEIDETFQVEGMDPFTVMNYAFLRWEKEDGVWKIDRYLGGPRGAPPEG
jgi:ketosteroid isomerase-like protein